MRSRGDGGEVRCWPLILISLVLFQFAGCGHSTSGNVQQRSAKPGTAVVIALATTTRVPAAAPVITPIASPAPAPPQICLVTPQRGVPESYVPTDLVALPQSPFVGPGVSLRREAATALQRLLNGAAEQHVYLRALSGYRSAELQQQTLQQEITLYGEAKARREVAQPGHSEHQLGVAVDVLAQRDPNDLDQSFGDTLEGRWLAASAPGYGFVLSYPAGKEAITGYIYEPWHIRYVGVPLAQEIAASGLTATEYLPLHHMDGCP